MLIKDRNMYLPEIVKTALNKEKMKGYSCDCLPPGAIAYTLMQTYSELKNENFNEVSLIIYNMTCNTSIFKNDKNFVYHNEE